MAVVMAAIGGDADVTARLMMRAPLLMSIMSLVAMPTTTVTKSMIPMESWATCSSARALISAAPRWSGDPGSTIL